MRACLTVAAVVFPWSGSALGQTAAPAETRPHWYGYETLLVDAGAVGLGAAAISVGSTKGTRGAGLVLAPFALAAYLVGPPIMHFRHDRPGAAAASFGLRAALPAAGFGLGYLAYAAGHKKQGELSGVYMVFTG